MKKKKYLKKKKNVIHVNKTTSSSTFCHKCYIKNSFDNCNCALYSSCKMLPIKKIIKNSKNLMYCLKIIIKNSINIIKNKKNKKITKKRKNNLCYVFKFKIKIKEEYSTVYLINFPICNIKNNNIFCNNNNEKTLLFLFNKKIRKTIKNINNYSNFIFPFNNSKDCQKADNLKKKIIYFLSRKKSPFYKTNKNTNKLTWEKKNNDKDIIEKDVNLELVASDQRELVKSDQQELIRSDQRELVTHDQRELVTHDQRELVTHDQRELVTSDQQRLVTSDQRELVTSSQRELVKSDQQELIRSDQRELVTSEKCLSENSTYKAFEKEKEKKVKEEYTSSMHTFMNKQTEDIKKEPVFTKYRKKDIIFHIHMFELLIRLIFDYSKTYFTFFISKLTCVDEFYKNMYYLNLSKLVNIKIQHKKKKKKKSEKDMSTTSVKMATEMNIKNLNIKNERSTNNLLNKLIKENDDYKTKINEKDEKIISLNNEIKNIKQNIIQLENELTKQKDENLNKIKIIENLKNKIHKKDVTQNDKNDKNNSTDQLLKNSNYIKKLYNENNILKDKIKKLNSLTKRQCSSSLNPLPNILDKKEFSKTDLVDNKAGAKENDQSEKANFYFNAFLNAEQTIYTADIVINTQKEIIAKIKKDHNDYLEEFQKSKDVFKKEIEKSLDFIYSVCEDIKTKKEKICLTNRINKLHENINNFLYKFEKEL
ncbi:conserved protein, unknown function [Hepatocystis sp. ex Piliocolobus tephrosceles]|nr:conserved protein, unknown function [Hepatocystis sp. ex Piliocolobus tephrosceles]